MFTLSITQTSNKEQISHKKTVQQGKGIALANEIIHIKINLKASFS